MFQAVSDTIFYLINTEIQNESYSVLQCLLESFLGLQIIALSCVFLDKL